MSQLPASFKPWPCVILAVDPGETSGWATWAHGHLDHSGEADTYDSRDLATVIEGAARLSTDCSSGLVVLVIENAVPIGKLGRPQGGTRTIWRKAWQRHPSVRNYKNIARIVGVAAPRWRSKVLSRGNLPKGKARAEEAALATRLAGTGLIGHDEAAAICIGKWASHAGEVGAKLPKTYLRKRGHAA